MSNIDPDRCLTDAELTLVLQDDLSPADLELATNHLGHCDQCQVRLERMASPASLLPGSDCPGTTSQSEALRAVLDRLQHPSFASGAGRAPEGERRCEFLGPPSRPGYIGRFGGYDILEHAASGGMGVVFKGHDPGLNRIVAIKVLAPALAQSDEARARFLREARAAAAVVHENVVAIHAVGEEKGLPYLVMQFIRGKPLQARLAAGPLELKEILRIGIQAAAGLAAAHAQGLIHRDIKPANILLENSVERVKLTDFGLARAVDEPGVTRPGVIAGTPEYMAPEQARGERIDARADLFSLGAVLYAMATGTPAFAADSTLATLRRVCEWNPPAPERINPALPAWLSAIVLKLLAKDPHDRFQNAAELARILEDKLAALQSGVPLPELASTTVMPRPTFVRNRGRIGAALLLFALLVLGGYGVWTTRHPAQKGASATASFPVSFSLLRPDGSTKLVLDSLRKAVAAASPGEIIEVAGTGAVPCEPVRIHGRAAHIRAARDGAPALVSIDRTAPLFYANAPLVLEGLELRAAAGDSDIASSTLAMRSALMSSAALQVDANNVMASLSNQLIFAQSAPVYLANCRLVGPSVAMPGQECLRFDNTPRVVLQNCELYHAPGPTISWSRDLTGETPGFLRMTNCIALGRETFFFNLHTGAETRLECQQNTFVGLCVVDKTSEGALTVHARLNAFEIGWMLRPRGPDGPGPTERSWRGVSNLYCLARVPRGPGMRMTETEFARAMARRDTGSVIGEPRLGRRIAALRTRISPDAFRLASTQETATPAPAKQPWQDIGADVGRVGPGEPYRLWRASSAYVQWMQLVSPARN